MNKFKEIINIACLILFVFVVHNTAFAQNQDVVVSVAREVMVSQDSPEAFINNKPAHFNNIRVGIPADSVFYFLDLGFEKLSLLLTFNQSKKIKKLENYSHERMEELYRYVQKPNFSMKKIEKFILRLEKNIGIEEKIIEQKDGLSNFGELYLDIAESVYNEQLWMMHNIDPVLGNSENINSYIQIKKCADDLLEKKISFLSSIGYTKLDLAFQQYNNWSGIESGRVSESVIPVAYAKESVQTFFGSWYTTMIYEKIAHIAEQTSLSSVKIVVLAKRESIFSSLEKSLSLWYSPNVVQNTFENWINNADVDYVLLMHTLERMKNGQWPGFKIINFDHLFILTESLIRQQKSDFKKEEVYLVFSEQDINSVTKYIEDISENLYSCLDQKKCNTSVFVDKLIKNIAIIEKNEILQWYKNQRDNFEKYLLKSDLLNILNAIDERDDALNVKNTQNEQRMAGIISQIDDNKDIRKIVSDDMDGVDFMLRNHTDGYSDFIINIKDALDLNMSSEDYSDVREQIRKGLSHPPKEVNTLSMIAEMEAILKYINFSEEQKDSVTLFLKKLNEKVNEDGFAVILQEIEDFYNSLPEEMMYDIRRIQSGEFDFSKEITENNEDVENKDQLENTSSNDSSNNENSEQIAPELTIDDVFDDDKDVNSHDEQDYFPTP